MNFELKVRETLKVIDTDYQGNPSIKIICPKQNTGKNYRNKTTYSFNSMPKQDELTFQFISKEHIEIIEKIKKTELFQTIKDLFIKSNNLNKIQLCFTLFSDKLNLIMQTPEEFINNILEHLNNSNIVSIYYRLYTEESKTKIDSKEIKQYPFNESKKLIENILGIKLYLSPYTFSRINTDISPKIYEDVLNNYNQSNNIILYGRDIYFLYKYLNKQQNLNSNPNSNTNPNILGITHCKITYNDIIEDENKFKSKIVYSEKKDYTKNLELNQLPKSTVILTAGRNGLSLDLIEYFLRQIEILEIVYIACNRKSMSRDLGILKNQFTLNKLVIIDEFPNTDYNNTILNLRRKT